MRSRFCISWLLLLVLPTGPLRASRESAPPAGVVVAGVAPGSAADQAGLRPEDVILSWSRAPAQGSIASPFDLTQAVIEQAPRGGFALAGRRGETAATWTIPAGRFGLVARPALEADLLALYREGREQIQAKKVEEGVGRWRAAAREAQGRGEAALGVWLLAATAQALGDALLWPQADAAYDEAVRGAEARLSPAATAEVLRQWAEMFRRRSDSARADECDRKALARDEGHAPDSL